MLVDSVALASSLSRRLTTSANVGPALWGAAMKRFCVLKFTERNPKRKAYFLKACEGGGVKGKDRRDVFCVRCSLPEGENTKRWVRCKDPCTCWRRVSFISGTEDKGAKLTFEGPIAPRHCRTVSTRWSPRLCRFVPMSEASPRNLLLRMFFVALGACQTLRWPRESTVQLSSRARGQQSAKTSGQSSWPASPHLPPVKRYRCRRAHPGAGHDRRPSCTRLLKRGASVRIYRICLCLSFKNKRVPFLRHGVSCCSAIPRCRHSH